MRSSQIKRHKLSSTNIDGTLWQSLASRVVRFADKRWRAVCQADQLFGGALIKRLFVPVWLKASESALAAVTVGGGRCPPEGSSPIKSDSAVYTVLLTPVMPKAWAICSIRVGCWPHYRNHTGSLRVTRAKSNKKYLRKNQNCSDFVSWCICIAICSEINLLN